MAPAAALADCDAMQDVMRSAFEVELPHRVRRAVRVTLQPYAPANWLSAVASECAELYVAGSFYGAISVAVSYVDGVTHFLSKCHHIHLLLSAEHRCERLLARGLITQEAADAMLNVVAGTARYGQLDKDGIMEYRALADRAEQCLASVATIESCVFAYTLDERERVIPRTPEYWYCGSTKRIAIKLRQLW